MKRRSAASGATLLVGLVMMAGGALATSYTVDRAHSSVEFKVRHMAISKVRGSFSDFDATFTYVTGEPQSWQARATIQAASIDTGVERRDDHLRSAEFLEVDKYPTIEFTTSQVVPVDGGYLMKGELTMHGVTRPVELQLEPYGVITDPRGRQRAGFSATGKIDRKDYGLTWNKILEGGGLLVGDEVEITIEMEGVATGLEAPPSP
jgi:polyisoprenoid-binding protein YceI